MSTTLAPAAADTPAAPGAAAAPQQQQQQQQQLAGETQLAYLCRNTQACVLRPYCFFVSWQGVLTLAYRGFPAPLAALKQAVPGFYGGLPKESPGSKWPKTRWACLACVCVRVCALGVLGVPGVGGGQCLQHCRS
jgi:hypothetical protein